MALREPGWSIPSSAEMERSISLSKGSMIKILREHYENADAFRLVQALVSSKGKVPVAPARQLEETDSDVTTRAREAIRKLKIPQLLKDEFLEACIKSHIPVPLVREDWESLQREIGAAFVAMISIICFQDTTRADQEFGQTASILFRDRSKRAYAFSATADSSRRVYVHIGMPYCEGQGIGAVCGRAAVNSPRTVHHPERVCAVGGGAKLVSLDVPERMQIPRHIAMHHREGDSAPPADRTSFEGDNMLLVPTFRRYVFSSIARLAIQVMEIRAWEGMAGTRATVPEAAEIRGFLNPDLGIVVSTIQETKIDTTSKPWSLESRF